MIVGIAAACVFVTIAAVLSAIYFRKHPDQWAAAQAWGPNKIKNIKRSFAARV